MFLYTDDLIVGFFFLPGVVQVVFFFSAPWQQEATADIKKDEKVGGHPW